MKHIFYLISTSRYLIFFTIVFFVNNICVLANINDKNAAEDYYHLAEEYFHAGKNDSAVVLLESAVKSDNKYVEAYHLLGVIKMESDKVHERLAAQRALEKAVKLEPSNIEFRLSLARCRQRRGFEHYALDEYKRITEIDSTCMEAWYQIGLFYERQMLNFRNKVDVEDKALLYDDNMINNRLDYGHFINPARLRWRRESAFGMIYFAEYAEEDKLKSASAFEHMLSIDPTNQDALFRRGLLYYEEKNYEEFVALFEELIKYHPESKNGHLFLGLGYHLLDKNRKADQHFQMAKNFMSLEELSVFESIEYLLSDIKRRSISFANAYMDSIAHIRFWREMDPLFLTSYNERQLEHYSRVAIANLRYGIPEKDIPGWKTDRGKTLIKYGIPSRIFRRTEPDGSWLREYWYYPQFTFVFEAFQINSDNFHYASFDGVSYEDVARDIEREVPEMYQYKDISQRFNFAYSMASFRGMGNKTRLEFYFGIPAGKIRFQKQGLHYTSYLNRGIFLFDKRWEEKAKFVDTKQYNNMVPIDTTSESLIVDTQSLNVSPGSYNCAIELQDPFTGNIGTYRQPITVQRYRYDSLQVSDILMASNISIIDPASETREGIHIIPNPVMMYHISQPLFIYFEIYNLIHNPVGITHYRVTYSIEKRDQKGVLSSIFTKVLGKKKRVEFISSSFDYQGTAPFAYQYLRIDHNLADPDKYYIKLTVTDLNSASSTEKETFFYLIN